MKRSWVVVFAVLVLATSHPVWSAPVTLHLDELPFQPVDGLSFMGVTFGFTVGGLPSLDANYNSGGPGSITFVQDPSLEGNSSGILTMDFSGSTPILEFGAALSDVLPLRPGLTVELFDAGHVSIGVFGVDTDPLVSFTEGRFTHVGVPVSRAVLDFDDAPGRFAIDNITFDIAAVPGPSTVLLVGSGLLGFGAVARRRHRPN